MEKKKKTRNKQKQMNKKLENAAESKIEVETKTFISDCHMFSIHIKSNYGILPANQIKAQIKNNEEEAKSTGSILDIGSLAKKKDAAQILGFAYHEAMGGSNPGCGENKISVEHVKHSISMMEERTEAGEPHYPVKREIERSLRTRKKYQKLAKDERAFLTSLIEKKNFSIPELSRMYKVSDKGLYRIKHKKNMKDRETVPTSDTSFVKLHYDKAVQIVKDFVNKQDTPYSGQDINAYLIQNYKTELPKHQISRILRKDGSLSYK